MTSKDYRLIAATIRSLIGVDRFIVAVRFADVLEAENGRFERGLFIAACMKEVSK